MRRHGAPALDIVEGVHGRPPSMRYSHGGAEATMAAKIGATGGNSDMGSAPASQAQGFCRDCLALAPAAGRRCAACGSPRLLRHPELDGLAVAHLDCDAF